MKRAFNHSAAIALIMASLALAGCATGPRPVEVRIQERTVEVMRPCPVTAPERPAPITDLPANARDALRVVVAKLLEWQGAGGYADRAEAAIAVCVGG